LTGPLPAYDLTGSGGSDVPPVITRMGAGSR